MNTKNSGKLEKSRGILAFAYNTETTNYEIIAKQTLALASHTLGLPYTLITEKLRGSPEPELVIFPLTVIFPGLTESIWNGSADVAAEYLKVEINTSKMTRNGILILSGLIRDLDQFFIEGNAILGVKGQL